MFRGSVKGTGYPPHSPVSTSLPLAGVTVCHQVSTGLYIYLLGVVTLGCVNGVREAKMAQSIECLGYELGDPELDSWQE